MSPFRFRIVIGLLALFLLLVVLAGPGGLVSAQDPDGETTVVPLIRNPDDSMLDSSGDRMAPPGNVPTPTPVPGGPGSDPNEPPSSSGNDSVVGGSDSDGNGGSGGTNDSGNPVVSGGGSSDDGGFLCFSPALALIALGAIGLFDGRLLGRRRQR